MFIFCRKKWKFTVVSLLFVVCISFCYNNIILPHFRITPGSVREILSVPFQQTARHYKYYNDEISESDIEIIDKILDVSDLDTRYQEEISDPVKNKFNKYTTNDDLKDYFKVWFKYFLKRPCTYISATINNTYGYFPILYTTLQTVKAQIAIGVQTYKKYFGKQPRGIWLPECGYVPEADEFLKEFGIEYIITESHGILYADPTPIYGTFAPIVSPNGVIAFGRDIESSRQVWSSINGYPGDYNYREFYRDIGYEADYDYIKPYIASNGARVHTGIKYYRITRKN